jgi:phosphoribosylformimino-5-aminoimidazole carboxamide ribotide isomerase
MKILPVLDLLDGVVVRGVAGKRDEYRPVESCLVENANALSIARAFRSQFNLDELYLADLDAILHDRPNLSLIETLTNDGFRLHVDAGLREVSRARQLRDAGVETVVAGLETLPGPEFVEKLCHEIGRNYVVFSLDMQGGRLLGDLASWNTVEPFAVAEHAVSVGIQQMIVLDLEQVGVSQGVSTSELCRRLMRSMPFLKVITGGGVRNVDDLRGMQEDEFHGVLVASAFHSGAITPQDILTLSANSGKQPS